MSIRREFEVAVVGLGGIGSSATYWASKRAGADVLGLERFELGHERGASQDHSRLIRLSYHTPNHVRFAQDAYRSWAEVEEECSERIVLKTGGVDLYPESAYGWMGDYTMALDEVGVPYEWMGADELMRRWPQWVVSPDVRVNRSVCSNVGVST